MARNKELVVYQNQRPPTTPIARLMARFRRKDLGDPSLGAGSGWTSATQRYWTGPRHLEKLSHAYGGSNDSVTWVFAAISWIASTGASYPYKYVNDAGKSYTDPEVDTRAPELRPLVRRPDPNPATRKTYFDFQEWCYTDLELTGNSYWLKDQMNALGRPAALRRLEPGAMRIAVNSAGVPIGYAYTINNREVVPYDLAEIIHFKYPNPLSELYGMGTVEATIRALDQEIAQSLHVTGFFQNGARIAGVLTVSDALSEVQFERLKQQFKEEYAGAANAFKTLIAEGTSKFEPISHDPTRLAVVDLKKLSKDEILTGFGLPSIVLGGAAEQGVYKMEEAQHIALRTMLPKAKRVSEVMTFELCELFGEVVFQIDPYASEPMSTKIDNAKNMLEAGASVDEARETMGLARLNTDQTSTPVLPTTLMPVDALGQPTHIVPTLRSINGHTNDPTALARLKALGTGDEPFILAPPLPHGFERLGQVKTLAADLDLARVVLDEQARYYHASVPIVEKGMRPYFLEQRARVLEALSKFSAQQRQVQRGKTPRDELEVGGVFDLAQENKRLRDLFAQIANDLGMKAVEMPNAVLGMSFVWDQANPKIAAFVDQIGTQITGINDTTRSALAEQIELGLTRGYSIPQIANGVRADTYKGLIGVFDDATGNRLDMIARTESAFVLNGAATMGYQEAGINEVEVLDGVDDPGCADANGSTWSLDQAMAEPIEHPRCIRSFVPIVDTASVVVPDEGA